jgi:tryptophan 2,3-dioxygenase
MPRTAANYDSLIELVKRILAMTAGAQSKKLRQIHRMIGEWKVPDQSEVLSPHTHSSASPAELNPAPRPKAPTKPGPVKKGPPKAQVSKGGIILPGDPRFQETAP